MNVLIVDADHNLTNGLSQHLSSCGFSVNACFDMDEAQLALQGDRYDIVVLDVLLPHGSGLELVQWMRRQGINAAALFLTSRASVADRVLGLDSGADDYMAKPFSLDELSARIRALSRRLTANRDNLYRIADLSLDIKRRTVRRGGRDIALSFREFSILEYLVRNAGIVISRVQIEHYVWNNDYIGNSNIVEVYISALRRKIDAGSEKKLIHTIRSVGYTIKE